MCSYIWERMYAYAVCMLIDIWMYACVLGVVCMNLRVYIWLSKEACDYICMCMYALSSFLCMSVHTLIFCAHVQTCIYVDAYMGVW